VMAQLDEPTSEAAIRAAFDELIAEAAVNMPSLQERAEALDYELSSTEGSLRMALAAAGRSRSMSVIARRIICLRRLLDLVWFLDRNSGDPVLRKRLLELKKEEENGGSGVDK
jgi:hypothetical protein